MSKACFPALSAGVLWLFCATSAGAADSSYSGTANGSFPELDDSQLGWLGEQIYRNECNSKSTCLVAWNAGEDFPSLGIGHFIWYRSGQAERFVETFPGLLVHLQLSGVALPAWLHPDDDQPWPDRQSFLADQNSERQQQLRSLLEQTREQQTAYIVERFERLQAAQDGVFAARPELAARMQAVATAQIPFGLYALIDYVHFKGEGTNTAERYADTGWGLVQVLEAMPAASEQPLQDFVVAAKAVLSRRVANAPIERNEQRWLAGWHHRVDTYLPPATP